MPLPAMRRLMRELKELRTSPPEGIRVQLNEESVLDLVGILEGPGMSFRHFDRNRIDVFLQRVHHTKAATFA